MQILPEKHPLESWLLMIPGISGYHTPEKGV
nr:MAG TPA: hypothetical protein [Caudoviricetes sp.]